MGYNYKREARLITEVFKTKKIRAQAIVPLILTPTFVMYRIMIDDLKALTGRKSIGHIALKVSNVRKTAVHARFLQTLCSLNFRQSSRTLYWDDDRKIVPHTMVMGRGTNQVQERIGYRLPQDISRLDRGMTGSGKSVMLQKPDSFC